MNSVAKPLISLLAVAPSLTATLAAEPASWMSKPEIKHIRAIYNQIESAAKAGTFKRKAAPKRCIGEGNGSLSEAYTAEDGKGAVRKLYIAYGSEDSVGQVSYYYDRNGRHRFTYQYVGAVNDTRRESRIYFDENGKELHHDVRLLEGPGYPTSIETYVPDPKKYLLRLCDEAGSKSP